MRLNREVRRHDWVLPRDASARALQNSYSVIFCNSDIVLRRTVRSQILKQYIGDVCKPGSNTHAGFDVDSNKPTERSEITCSNVLNVSTSPGFAAFVGYCMFTMTIFAMPRFFCVLQKYSPIFHALILACPLSCPTFFQIR